MIKDYSVRVDGFELKKISLCQSDWTTQAARDIVRAKIAQHYKVPIHYIKLVQIKENQKYYDDPESGKRIFFTEEMNKNAKKRDEEGKSAWL